MVPTYDPKSSEKSTKIILNTTIGDDNGSIYPPDIATETTHHQNERAQLLERTLKNGYIDDYSGIRVSKTGKRFKIDQAIIWNITDENGHYYGQAATFDTWHYLPPIPSVHTNP